MDADDKSALFGISGAVLIISATVTMWYSSVLGMMVYVPAFLIGIILGFVGFAYSFKAKILWVRIMVWMCSLVSVGALYMVSKFPAF